jgi:hypothetical protein
MDNDVIITIDQAAESDELLNDGDDDTLLGDVIVEAGELMDDGEDEARDETGATPMMAPIGFAAGVLAAPIGTGRPIASHTSLATAIATDEWLVRTSPSLPCKSRGVVAAFIGAMRGYTNDSVVERDLAAAITTDGLAGAERIDISVDGNVSLYAFPEDHPSRWRTLVYASDRPSGLSGEADRNGKRPSGPDGLHDDHQPFFAGFPYNEEHTSSSFAAMYGGEARSYAPGGRYYNPADFYAYPAMEGMAIRVFHVAGVWYTTTQRNLMASRGKWASKRTFGARFSDAVRATLDQRRAYCSGETNEASDAGVLAAPIDDDTMWSASAAPSGAPTLRETGEEVDVETAMDYLRDEFYSRWLNPRHKYVFFLATDEDERVVCVNDPRIPVYLVATFDEYNAVSYDPLPIAEHDEFAAYGFCCSTDCTRATCGGNGQCVYFPMPPFEEAPTADEVAELAQRVSPYERQGYMLFAKDGRRVIRVQNEEYARLAELRSAEPNRALRYLQLRPRGAEAVAEYIRLYAEFRDAEDEIYAMCERLHELYMFDKVYKGVVVDYGRFARAGAPDRGERKRQYEEALRNADVTRIIDMIHVAFKRDRSRRNTTPSNIVDIITSLCEEPAMLRDWGRINPSHGGPSWGPMAPSHGGPLPAATPPTDAAYQARARRYKCDCSLVYRLLRSANANFADLKRVKRQRRLAKRVQKRTRGNDDDTTNQHHPNDSDKRATYDPIVPIY